MSGTWGLKEMGSVVRPVAVSSAPAIAATSPVVNGLSKPLQPKMSAPIMAEPTATKQTPAPVGPRAVPARTAAVAPVSRPAGGTAQSTSAQAVAESLAAAPQVPTRRPAPEDRIVLEPEENAKSRTLFWAALAAVAVLLIGLIWHFTHVSESSAKTAVPAVIDTPQTQPGSAGTPAAGSMIAMKPSAATAQGAAGSRRRMPTEHGTAPAGSQWRLVAYTFNREEQAQRKVEAIGQLHPELKPEVFSPSGRAPYLVALGGWMSVDQASALKSRAKSEGLPQDIYTQNYRSH